MKDLLVKPSILGNEPKTRSNQSILAATRLWHLASKEVKIEQVKPADPNRFRITPPKVESKPQRIWIPALGT